MVTVKSSVIWKFDWLLKIEQRFVQKAEEVRRGDLFACVQACALCSELFHSQIVCYWPLPAGEIPAGFLSRCFNTYTDRPASTQTSKIELS